MGDFHFLRPFWLLAFLPVLGLWWHIYRQQNARAVLEDVIDPHLLEHLFIGEGKARLLRPVNLLLAFWLIMVLALAGPSWKREASPFAGEDAGLVVLLKVSETMNATDVQPSRLDRAKFKLRDLLEERAGAPSALIVYSGSAHLVMPLTRDERILSAMVEDLTPDLMPADGDALAEALERAEALLNRAKVPGSVVVLADAVSPTQDISRETTGLPVQFLAIKSPEAPLDSGMEMIGTRVRAGIVPMTNDTADVRRIARRARSELTSDGESGQKRWRDGGYALIPFIFLIGLFWSRKGWVVQ